jgi:hypothetical protein
VVESVLMVWQMNVMCALVLIMIMNMNMNVCDGHDACERVPLRYP